jgi:hypothetical protein
VAARTESSISSARPAGIYDLLVHAERESHTVDREDTSASIAT